VVGPTGAQGAPSNVVGPTGAQGAPSNVVGPTGAQGAPSNVVGPTGSTGPTGPQGNSNAYANAMNQGVATTDSPNFVNVTANSDERLKTNIRNIENALDKVMQLRGVLFTRINDGVADTGVIAQDVLKVLPEAVKLNDTGFYAVAYGNIVGLLIEAIKELKDQLDEVKKKLP
jgi:hypothetical protein